MLLVELWGVGRGEFVRAVPAAIPLCSYCLLLLSSSLLVYSLFKVHSHIAS